MVATLTQALLAKLEPGDYEVHDTQQTRLVLRVRTSGQHAYLVRLGKGKRRRWYTLGSALLLKPQEARDMAHDVLAAYAKGKDPEGQKRKANAATFALFLEKQYEPWAVAHLKSAPSFVARIKTQFLPLFGKTPLSEITPWAVEKWRAGRLRGRDAVKPSTVNRDLVALKACLSKAVQWKLLSEHPLKSVKRSKEDRGGVVRFLSTDEEKKLRTALKERDAKRRTARERANTWRRERGYMLLPDHRLYTDHMTPVVLLAVNTGLRLGELLKLDWADVDLVRGILTVRGEGAKSGRTRHVPLNAEAQQVLKAWGPAEGLVFPGDDGAAMTTLKTAWLKVADAAKLKKFRFHDLRHSFASKLVQRGVDLNTVRELLGHSDFSLTLRYAHLAAENKAAAVAKLVGS